jgi:hypothetical protein
MVRAVSPLRRSSRLTDIFEEVAEDLRRDRVNEFWNRYRWAIYGGAALVVAGTAAFNAWRGWQRQQDEAMGGRYAEAAALAETDPAKATAALEVLAANGDAGYPLLARFRAASLKAKDKDPAGGIAAYKAIAADSGVDQTYRDLATVLAALYEVDTAPQADVAGELRRLTIAPNPWRFTAIELTALADLRNGDRAGALKLYNALVDDLAAPRTVRARAAELAAYLSR